MREIWIRILQTGGVKFYALIVSIISIAITTRALGPEARGILVTVNTWVTAFTTFGYLSLNQVVIHKAAKEEGNKWLSSSLNTLIYFTLTMTFLSWISVYCLYNYFSYNVFQNIPSIILVLGFSLIPFKIWEHYSLSLLQSIQQLNIHNKFKIIGSTIGLITMLFLVIGFNFKIEGVLISYIITQIIISIGGFNKLFKIVGAISLPKIDDVKYFIFNGLKLHMNAIGAFFITGTDILMINYYKGPSEAAFYQIGVQMIMVIVLIPQSAAMVLYEKVSELGPDKAWIYNRKIILKCLMAIIFIDIISGLSAPYWLVYIVGESFNSIIMAPQWIARGYFLSISILSIIISLTNLFLNFNLIPKYGMYGAIYSTLFTYIISIIVNGFMFVKCEKNR